MRIIPLIIAILLAPLFTAAQQFHINKTLFIGGDSIDLYIENSASLTDGGIAFTGLVTRGGKGDVPAATHASRELLFGKVDSNLNIQWLKLFGTSSDDVGENIIELTDGGFAIAGVSAGIDGDVNTASHGDYDIWLSRYDKYGSLQWSKLFGSPGPDAAYDIRECPDHGFIICGVHEGNLVGGDVSFCYTNSPFADDWLLVKTDSLGNKQWSKVMGGTGLNDIGFNSVIARPDGFYMIGASDSHDGECTDHSWYPAGVSTNSDIFLFKIDYSGNIIWSKSYGGTGYENVKHSIWVDKDSSILIAGTTNSNDYQLTGNHGGEDFFVIKVSSNGSYIWGHQYGTVNDDYGCDIVENYQHNGYVLLGQTLSGPGPIGAQDFLIAAIDSNGTMLTQKIFGSVDNDAGMYVSLQRLKGGYAAIGEGESTQFTEGTNIHSYHAGQFGSISYVSLYPLGVDPLESSGRPLSVYPNPTKGKLTIKLPEHAGMGILTIIDISGTIAYKQNTKGQEITIETRSWTKGVYMASWQGEGGVVRSAKISVE